MPWHVKVVWKELFIEQEFDSLQDCLETREQDTAAEEPGCFEP